MQVVDVFEWKKAVQRGVDGRCNGIAAKRAEWIEIHHFIFEFDAAITAVQRLKLGKIKSRETLPIDAADVSATAFDPEHGLPGAVERVRTVDLGAGIPAPEISDPQVRAQDVGPVAQLVSRIEAAGNVVVP